MSRHKGREAQRIEESRRTFLRWSMGAAMVGGVSLLVLRPRGEACEITVGCDECSKFAGCGLPKAQDRRVRQASPAKPEGIRHA